MKKDLMISIRPATQTERMYTYTQSCQIQGQTGCLGYLKANWGPDEELFMTWYDLQEHLKSDQFMEEFDQLINRLRFGKSDREGIRREDENCFLKDRVFLARYCQSYPSARMSQEEEIYGFRVDTDNYAYLMRFNPEGNTCNMYCYCYRRDCLDHHLKNAERGIRFIDTDYRELFRIPDGGKVRVTYYDGKVREAVCRFVDDYHLEFGSNRNLYHISELSEIMEKSGNKVEPIDIMPIL